MGLNTDETWCIPSIIGPVIRQGEQKLDSLLLSEFDKLVESPEAILPFVWVGQ